MAIVVTHTKTDALTDWTQAQLDAAIAGNYPPIPPGTVLSEIVLPSDWNDNHVITGLATVAETGDYNDLINKPTIPAGTVTSVSVTTANGVSGSVATATTTPAISLTLGAITPSSVASAGTVTGSNLSGTNTGDQTTSGTAGEISVATGGANPVISLPSTLTLTGKTINGGTFAPASVAATGNVTGLNLSGTNTGDQNVFNTTGSSDFFAFAAAHG
jgi:hypothetical protein